MSAISKLKHSRCNWKAKSIKSGKIVRYQQRELIRIKKERNAYKKIVGIRRTWPKVFWALGPRGYSKVYEISRTGEYEFNLTLVDEARLQISNVLRPSPCKISG